MRTGKKIIEPEESSDEEMESQDAATSDSDYIDCLGITLWLVSHLYILTFNLQRWTSLLLSWSLDTWYSCILYFVGDVLTHGSRLLMSFYSTGFYFRKLTWYSPSSKLMQISWKYDHCFVRAMFVGKGYWFFFCLQDNRQWLHVGLHILPVFFWVIC